MVARSRSKSWRLIRLEAISPRGAPVFALVSNSRLMNVSPVRARTSRTMTGILRQSIARAVVVRCILLVWVGSRAFPRLSNSGGGPYDSPTHSPRVADRCSVDGGMQLRQFPYIADRITDLSRRRDQRPRHWRVESRGRHGRLDDDGHQPVDRDRRRH